MFTKDQIIAKLDEFKSYESEYKSHAEAVMASLYSLVEDYFDTQSVQLINALKEMVFNLYCDIIERETEYENGFNLAYPNNFPATYNDIRLCFYDFPLMYITAEEFNSAWVTIPPETEGEVSTIENTYVTEWTSELTNAKQFELEDVKALTEWCQNSASTSDFIQLFEDTGVVIKSPSTEEVAQSIYIDKGLLEAIQTLNLDVYIPSYLK